NVTTTLYSLTDDTFGAVKNVTVPAPEFSGAPVGSNVWTTVYTPDITSPNTVSLTIPLTDSTTNPNPWVTTLDRFGNVTSAKDPLLNTWLFGYNTNGTELSSVTDPTGLAWHFYYGEPPAVGQPAPPA
ncbi:MAG: hypothetical protein C4321_10410, partial [Chloroflexota bacterium]